MKTVELQKYLITAIEKEEKIRICHYKDKYTVTDGYKAWFVPDCQFYLKEECFSKPLSESFVKGLTPDYYKVDLLKKTGVEKRFDKITAVELKNPEDETIWINKIAMKFFDKEATFKGTDKRSVIYVYEKEELVGVIMPFIPRKKTDGSRKKL